MNQNGRNNPYGPRCPDCDGMRSLVDRAAFDEDEQRLRYRACRECGLRFTTIEVPVLLDDGSPAPFTWFAASVRWANKLRWRKNNHYQGAVSGVRTIVTSGRIKVRLTVTPARYGPQKEAQEPAA